MLPKRNVIATIVLFLSVCVLGSCKGGLSQSVDQWWENFRNNPAAQVQVIENGVQLAISDATIAFQAIKPFLPADAQVKAQGEFDNAVLAVNRAEQALDDAVQAAAAAQQPNPDFSKLVAAVVDAVKQVIAIVDQYKGNPAAPLAPTLGPRPGEPRGLAEARAALLSLSAKK